MKILLDNLNGLGFVDYTSLVNFAEDSKIVRQLNKVAFCTFNLLLDAVAFIIPARLSRVQVTGSDGSVLFSGYINSSPNWKDIGAGQNGAAYQLTITAISDEATFDSELSTRGALLVGQSLQQNWHSLGILTTGSLVPVSVSQELLTTGRTNIFNGARWTEAAEALANSTRATYRADGSGIAVTSLGTISHVISADNPGLTFSSDPLGSLQWSANDITVCGNEEPTAYVTEIFQGDGATNLFTLSKNCFVPLSSQKASLQDSFQGNSLDSRLWLVNDSMAHLALTADGLACQGGSGKDGETIIGSTQLIELGGTTLLEATGVQIAGGSAGVILGLYIDTISSSTCFAGFTVSSTGNTSSLVAQVNGAVAGENFAVESSHLYTLRLKVFCSDMERVQQSYFYSGGSGTSSYGGSVMISSGLIELSIQDTISGIPGTPTLIYSASLNVLPSVCRLGLLNSGNLMCSVKSVRLVQTEPIRVGLAVNSNAPTNLTLGSTAEGASCTIRHAGEIEFYPASIPTPGSLVYVTYRAKGRAVARRMQNLVLSDVAAQVHTTWLGSAVTPSAWSSWDCDNAALALLNAATSLSVALKGSFVFHSQNMQKDVWPGDALSIGPYPDNTYKNAIALSVIVSLRPDSPDNALYTVKFDNEKVEGLSLRFSDAVPEDANIPQQPTYLDKSLPSLSKLTVTSITGTSIIVDTGSSAPVNGGFEVRRRDNTFKAGEDSDLVLRSATSNISIPRLAAVEQYYVRTYDANIPCNYSLFSAAIFVNVSL